MEFRDELRDRYEMKMLDSPSHYDGCNSSFSTTHDLSCKVGDLIHSYHDSIGCLVSTGFKYSNIRDEPLINPCHDIGRKVIEPDSEIECEINSDRGFWNKDTDCTVDANHSSYLSHKRTSII